MKKKVQPKLREEPRKPPVIGTARKPPRAPRILVYVEAVARHGSIRKAAEALNIASSALNRRILDLEEELGATLFERLPRGVRPTAAGELFLAYARRAIGELELVSSQIEQLKGLIRGRVNIAAVESVASEILPSAIAGFQSNHTGVRFHVNIGVPKDLLAVLIEDRVDLILTHDATRHRHINIVTTVRQTLCALVVPDHPLASRTELRLHECQGFPITLGDETLAGRALIEQCLGRSSFQIEPALVSNSIETMKAFSRMRGSVCFQFDTPGRTRAMGGDMIAIPLTDAPFAQAQLILATRRDRVLPLAAATFLEHIKAHLEAKFPPLPR